MLSYVGLASEPQIQDVNILLEDEEAKDSKQEDVKEEEDEETQQESDQDEEGQPSEEEESESDNFMDNFPNFYSMAADLMDRMDMAIPQVS